MKVLISGHRKSKILNYDMEFIRSALRKVLKKDKYLIGLSGMADGIDLLFCEVLLELGKGYYCYLPFAEQHHYMSDKDALRREELISKAWNVFHLRNSSMVEKCDSGVIIWDGNKGGTHNVFQQMIEAGKPFTWIEPVNKRIIKVGNVKL